MRERTTILQKLARTNLGAALQSLRMIYVSFIRPVLKYANPVLKLASHTSLEKLDRVRLHCASYWRLPGCEPLNLRRGEQTVSAQEIYLRTGEVAPLRSTQRN
ncbi:hypothetical protein PoB_000070200 [Plakobranchus ocellatus]|uniref:Uncharacterized protein n=1 Tax=Plakobranchus ocellatus TaxID=259542 RepID=A0AAV3XWG4_9GAST|nr:hypothetical protein PoB_000070200 [Plakobranchus ocellatus]